MFDHEYFKQVDSEMLSALKVLGRAMLSALDALIWYLLLQPIRLYSWLTDDPGAMNENDRRNAALAAAYSLSESALKQYQEKVVEAIGEEKEKELRQTITLDKMAKQPEETPVIVPAARDASYDQLVECYESFSGRYFKTTVNALDRAMNGLNKQLLSDFRVTQNDLFDYLGLEHTKNGDLLGWDTDSTLTIETFYSSKLDEDGMPCMVLDYSTPPKWLGY